MTVAEQAINEMVDVLMNNCNTEEFESLTDLITNRLKTKIENDVENRINNITNALERLNEKYKTIQLVNPNDPAQTNLLPLITKEWFKISINKELPKV